MSLDARDPEELAKALEVFHARLIQTMREIEKMAADSNTTTADATLALAALYATSIPFTASNFTNLVEIARSLARVVDVLGQIDRSLVELAHVARTR